MLTKARHLRVRLAPAALTTALMALLAAGKVPNLAAKLEAYGQE